MGRGAPPLSSSVWSEHGMANRQPPVKRDVTTLCARNAPSWCRMRTASRAELAADGGCPVPG